MAPLVFLSGKMSKKTSLSHIVWQAICLYNVNDVLRSKFVAVAYSSHM